MSNDETKDKRPIYFFTKRRANQGLQILHRFRFAIKPAKGRNTASNIIHFSEPQPGSPGGHLEEKREMIIFINY